VVYERVHRAWRLLRTGLAENRLPQDVLDWEINGILDAGVRRRPIENWAKISPWIRLLKRARRGLCGYRRWDTQMSEREREQALPGVRFSWISFSSKEQEETGLGRQVMILGGGKADLEAARECIKEGAKSVRS